MQPRHGARPSRDDLHHQSSVKLLAHALSEGAYLRGGEGRRGEGDGGGGRGGEEGRVVGGLVRRVVVRRVEVSRAWKGDMDRTEG